MTFDAFAVFSSQPCTRTCKPQMLFPPAVSYLPDLSLMPLPKDEALAHLHKSAGVVVRVDISVNGAPILWSPFFQAVSPIGVSTAMSSLLALPTQVRQGLGVGYQK